MFNILTSKKDKSGEYVVHKVTLDELWEEAESLGIIAVDKSWCDSVYTATIKFTNKNDSHIYAKGKDANIQLAVQKAIEEARSLK